MLFASLGAAPHVQPPLHADLPRGCPTLAPLAVLHDTRVHVHWVPGLDCTSPRGSETSFVPRETKPSFPHVFIPLGDGHLEKPSTTKRLR